MILMLVRPNNGAYHLAGHVLGKTHPAKTVCRITITRTWQCRFAAERRFGPFCRKCFLGISEAV